MKSLVYITVLFFSLSTFAQKPMAKKQKFDFTPEQQADIQSKRLSLLLDLSPKQTQQVKEIQLERAIQRKSMKEAHKKGKVNGEKPSTEEAFKLKSSHLDDLIAFQGKMKNILNEEQYKLWKETRKNNIERKQKHKAFKQMHQKGKKQQ